MAYGIVYLLLFWSLGEYARGAYFSIMPENVPTTTTTTTTVAFFDLSTILYNILVYCLSCCWGYLAQFPLANFSALLFSTIFVGYRARQFMAENIDEVRFCVEECTRCIEETYALKRADSGLTTGDIMTAKSIE